MEPIGQLPGVELSHEGLVHLDSTRKWAMFLAVMGFIGCGLMFLTGILFGAVTSLAPSMNVKSPLPGLAMFVMYTIMSVLYFFPALFLYKFAANMKTGVDTNASPALTEAFKYLRYCFTSVGLMTIVGICVFILFFVGVIIFAIVIGSKGM